jgi:uncharacterized membrane protein
MQIQNLVLIGMSLIFIGILLILIGTILGSKNVRTEWGFFGLIGPIPVGAWSSKKTFIFTTIIFIILILVLLSIKK